MILYLMKDLIKLLHEGGHSLVVGNGEVRTFEGRGVSDLLRLLEQEPDALRGASIADKVVGKGAAALMAVAGVKEVYADVISSPALRLLEDEGVALSFGQVVDNIQNRTGTGPCPVESRCLPCSTPEECLAEIRAFINGMKNDKAEQ